MNELTATDVIAAYLARSNVMHGLEVELREAHEGYVRLGMEVRHSIVNGQGVCHGGYIFLIADSACVCAAITRNEQAVTQVAQASFLAPARRGDRLIAEGTEIARGRRSATCDARVSTADGRLIALLRGTCHMTAAPVVEPIAG